MFEESTAAQIMRDKRRGEYLMWHYQRALEPVMRAFAARAFALIGEREMLVRAAEVEADEG